MERTAPIKIGPEFIDFNNHVNHTAPHLYFERHRSGLMYARGAYVKQIKDEFHLQAVMLKTSVDYKSEAKEGDELTIASQDSFTYPPNPYSF